MTHLASRIYLELPHHRGTALGLRRNGSVLDAAREMPELSSRQLAAWTTDNLGFAVSESAVYHTQRRASFLKAPRRN